MVPLKSELLRFSFDCPRTLRCNEHALGIVTRSLGMGQPPVSAGIAVLLVFFANLVALNGSWTFIHILEGGGGLLLKLDFGGIRRLMRFATGVFLICILDCLMYELSKCARINYR